MTKKTTIPLLTGYISGTRFQYDVRSKAIVVEYILSKKYGSKKEFIDYISSLASAINVTPVTIKAWIKKYQYTYSFFKECHVGVRSVSDQVIDEESERLAVIKELSKIRKLLDSHVYSRTSIPYSVLPKAKHLASRKMNWDLVL